jgi:hypothetical protein
VGAGRVKPDAQAEKDLAPLDRAAPKTARIVGKIATLKDKHVAVQIGSKTVEFDLADDPVINYSLSDPKLVATGSKVVVKGMGVRGRPNRCQADTITVTRLDVLEGKKKPANPGSAADKADGKTAAGKDPEKPGE